VSHPLAIDDRAVGGADSDHITGAIVVRKPQVQEINQIRARRKVDEWETVLCDLTFE